MEAGEMRGDALFLKECYAKLDAKTPEIHYRWKNIKSI
jgi:hypothetical protein